MYQLYPGTQDWPIPALLHQKQNTASPAAGRRQHSQSRWKRKMGTSPLQCRAARLPQQGIRFSTDHSYITDSSQVLLWSCTAPAMASWKSSRLNIAKLGPRASTTHCLQSLTILLQYLRIRLLVFFLITQWGSLRLSSLLAGTPGNQITT